MYKVIVKFADLEDGNHIYEVGNEYPRKGYEPTEERIAFLASNQNKLRTPVIEVIPIKEETPDKQEETPKKRSGKKSTK